MSARLLIGDVFDVLPTLPDASVDLVMTSPPFLALRSYLPADHADKHREIGSEPTPAEFIDTLLDLTEELARVLAPHGSLVVELGDTYSGSGGAGADYGENGRREGQPEFDGSARRSRPAKGIPGVVSPGGTTGNGNGQPRKGASWPLDKSLCLVPESYRWALTYGRNPFNGRQTPPWRVRNVVRWHRPNPPVGALGDKFRPATSELVVACKSRGRYFDLDAVRTHDGPGGNVTRRSSLNRGAPGEHTQAERDLVVLDNPNGAPPLDTWIIPTQPYAGTHYATFPIALCRIPIESMCPSRVCAVCGEPSRRIVRQTEDYAAFRALRNAEYAAGDRSVIGGHREAAGSPGAWADVNGAKGDLRGASRVTLGWTDCGHDSWRRGIVLDPFCGSGTTLAAAVGHGRDAIGIDLDERNAGLCRERVGMFLVEAERAFP